MSTFDHKSIDAKWQARWERDRTFATPTDRTRPKYYVLDMFPYPSGDGLHVGHPKGYTATDVVARAKRMMGFNVLHPMGWDSFGLPAERQAVRENRHPREITERNIARFKGQMQRLGLSYDWARELASSDPRYYKWTQWIFKTMFERGLAYRAEVAVNFCPAQGTVLANEEVHDGKYIETGEPVEKRLMKQWMLRITAYADRLIDDLDGLDWPTGTLEMQRDWIGRSVGANVVFKVVGTSNAIEVFTTRPDTLFGGTYLVLAPEHPLVDALTTPAQRAAVDRYRHEVSQKSERERLTASADAPKAGAFTGAHAINPVNGAEIPVWIADYVLAGYGTGAVFACPAHDERDWRFAKTFGLPIVEVVAGGDVERAAYAGDGPHVRSGFLDGLDVAAAKSAVINWLQDRGLGVQTTRYKLRDWLFSRQRYWGEPFPTLELGEDRIRCVPDDQLPVTLPALDAYRPTEDGQPPLARAAEWVNTVDPETGAPARRETNTMPQWAGSCWYYLRFLSPDRNDVAWDSEEEKYWMPVDLYVGGSEHATLHLLYARFWHKVLHDRGLVSTAEPFQRVFHQGMIHKTSFRDASGRYYYAHQVEPRDDRWYVKGSDIELETRLEKMSKSKYNVVNPDDLCEEYGADAVRLYELFIGPVEDGPEWDSVGVSGTRRFLDRVWRVAVHPRTGRPSGKLSIDGGRDNVALERALHAAIKKVTESVDTLGFNTAVAEMMVFVNEATRAALVPRDWFEAFVKILSPFAPHVAEELWERLGHTEGIAYQPWPQHDETKLARARITIAVQVEGRVRGRIEIDADATEADVLAAAKSNLEAQGLGGREIKRAVYVKRRLVNFVM